MQGTLIIHVGPPKTATTSLQYYWQNLSIENFKYLGVIAPRRANNEYLGKEIYKYCKANESSDDYDQKKNLKTKLANLLNKNKYVVFSEEMLLLENKSVSYLTKLKRLKDLTNSFNTIITFCIRDVDQAYFSYYTEIYKTLPLKLQNSFDEFQKSNYGDCYKYEKIYKTLFKIGFKKINFFYFKELINNELMMSEIMGINDLDYSFKVNLSRENITKVKNSNLSAIKKDIFKSIVIDYNHFFPVFVKGYGVGTFLKNIIKKEKIVTLTKTALTKDSKNIYKEDLIFFKSLKE